MPGLITITTYPTHALSGAMTGRCGCQRSTPSTTTYCVSRDSAQPASGRSRVELSPVESQPFVHDRCGGVTRFLLQMRSDPGEAGPLAPISRPPWLFLAVVAAVTWAARANARIFLVFSPAAEIRPIPHG